ncbi:MAG TPA: M20/M25/M40 family metallo-hydrolase [Candidatus Saccharimonadales bacterium]|nr:M20/M25/M40 family metallo-hydrolase [Candidatus Saccharimonadales bacterium]
MRLFSNIALILVLTAAVAAQRNFSQPAAYPPQLTNELKQLQQAALASDYAWLQLAHLTNNIGPRPAGSPQATFAAQYVAAELRKLGLDARLEKVTVPHWVRGEETGALVEFPGMAPGATQKVVLTALGGSVATPAEGLTAEVVVVNNFDELTALGRGKVAGKFVLFNAKFDKQLAATGHGGPAYGQAVVYRAIGASEAAKLGAIGALVRSVGGADYRLPHTGAMNYLPNLPRIPAAAISAEDADLLAYLSQQGPVRMHLLLTPQRLADVESFNVVADLKGSEHPEQTVIVSGHLDSWDLGTGAIDDGAGVVVAMQAAQLIKQLGLHPKRTIRVIAWMNEEFGVSGGLAYAAAHKDDAGNHFAAIESDLGAGHPLGFHMTAPASNLALLQPSGEILKASGAGLMQHAEDSETDIRPLLLLGVPCFGPIQDDRFYFNYHHTAADTLDKVVPRELQENAAVIAVLAYTLANLSQDLERPVPQPGPAF